MESQKTLGDQSITEQEDNEQVFKEMIEAEEELLEERRNAKESDNSKPVAANISAESVDLPPTTATIHAVVRENHRLRIEFYPGDSLETNSDTLPWPTNPQSDTEPLNRLCDLCGVPRGRLTELQGKTIPIVQRNGEFEVDVPKTTTKPALLIYRAWWWYRRREAVRSILSLAPTRKAFRVFAGAAALGVGNACLLTFATYSGTGPVDMFSHHFPAVYAVIPDFLAALIGLLIGILGLMTVPIDALVAGIILFGAVNFVRQWASDKAWPF